MRRLARCVLLILLAVCIPVSAASARELLASGGKTPLAKSSGVTTLRSTAQKTGKVKVIVGLRVPFSPEGRMRSDTVRVQRRDIATAASSVKARFQKVMQRDPKAFRSFDSIPFVAMEVTPEELDKLASDPEVSSIVENRLLKPMLAESSPLVAADKAWTGGYSGVGQTIAIIDTGVDKNHPFLAGKVVSEACYSLGRACPGNTTNSIVPGAGMPCSYNECNHGTHVAGIAAGLGSSFSGVARNANIIAIQVFSPTSNGLGAYDSDLIAALERVYALRNDFKIAAVNLSLGGGLFASSCDFESVGFTAAVNNLASAGIVTVAASGNDWYSEGISFPACISTVVSVGAVADAAPMQDEVDFYSNSAAILSLLAPGSMIYSSVPGNKYNAMMGTSMAAPHVAGAWAVVRQKVPNATISAILTAFEKTGKPIRDPWNGLVKPRIDVKAALDYVAPALTYAKLGQGSGIVRFSPTGALNSCSDNCSNYFLRDNVVTLTVEPGTNSVFQGWSGACTGTGACTVTMSQALSVSASFDLVSPPTEEPKLVLEYGKLGSGGGTVSFTPAGTLASCTESCSNSFTRGAVVTMAAVAAQGSTFKAWSGACTGTGACTVTMSQALSVSASFDLVSPPPEEPKLVLQYGRLGSGGGTVSFTPAGTLASCTESCSNSFARGAVVTMAAVAAQGSTFKAWSGACTGTGACTVTMSQALFVSASFDLVSQPAEEPKLVLQYGELGSGNGTVSFTPAGTLASCVNSCSNSFAAGTAVTLTATAAAGSAFLEWSGACSGNGVCTVTMSQAASVNARFVAASDKVLTYTKLGAGSGAVSFYSTAGTAVCAGSCTNSYDPNMRVTLKAAPSYGSAFGGWTGACRSRSKTCAIRMRDAASVTATFNVLPVYAMTIALVGSGSGSVALSAPDGIKTCNTNCSSNYPSGTRVRLTAAAAPGMVFAGWDGACRTQRATCTVTLRAARTVSASFKAP